MIANLRWRYWTLFCPKYCAWAGGASRPASSSAASSGCRVTSGRREREPRRVAPQPLELIEVPLARVKDMDHEVHEVEQGPASLGETLGVVGPHPGPRHRLDHVIRDRPHVRVRRAR